MSSFEIKRRDGKVVHIVCDDIPEGVSREELYAAASGQRQDPDGPRLIDAISPDDPSGGVELFKTEIAKIFEARRQGEIDDEEAQHLLADLADEFYEGDPSSSQEPRHDPAEEAEALRQGERFADDWMRRRSAAKLVQQLRRDPRIKALAREQLNFEDERHTVHDAAATAQRHPDLARLQATAGANEAISGIRANIHRIGVEPPAFDTFEGRAINARLRREALERK